MVRFKANIVNINILQMNVKRRINTYVLLYLLPQPQLWMEKSKLLVTHIDTDYTVKG